MHSIATTTQHGKRARYSQGRGLGEWHGLGVAFIATATAANNGLMWYKQTISSLLALLLSLLPSSSVKRCVYATCRHYAHYLPHKCIALVLEHAYLLYCAVRRECLLQDVLVEKARQGAIDAAAVDGAICGTALVVNLVEGQWFEIDCKQKGRVKVAYDI